MKLGIVVSDFNSSMTEKMLAKAQEVATSHDVTIVHVPGVYDMPLAVKKLLLNVDAVATRVDRCRRKSRDPVPLEGRNRRSRLREVESDRGLPTARLGPVSRFFAGVRGGR